MEHPTRTLYLKATCKADGQERNCLMDWSPAEALSLGLSAL